MVRLLGVLLAGAALWYGYKTVKREMQRVANELREADPEVKAKEIKPLKKGDDGVYRSEDD